MPTRLNTMNLKLLSEQFLSFIDSELEKQKNTAHTAIDLPDWTEAQQILREANENISQLHKWKTEAEKLFSEMKSSPFFLIDYQTNPCNEQESVVSTSDESEKIPCGDNQIAVISNQSEEHHSREISAHVDVLYPNAEHSDASPKQMEYDWHDLDEDYTYKKVNAIRFECTIEQVDSITDALVRLCDILYERDSKHFRQMLNASFIHGDKRRYLSYEPLGDIYGNGQIYDRKMWLADIYIWTDSSNNHKTALMQNMLHFFNIPAETVQLSIRNDYFTEKKEIEERKTVARESEKLDFSNDLPDDRDYVKPRRTELARAKDTELPAVAESAFQSNLSGRSNAEGSIQKDDVDKSETEIPEQASIDWSSFCEEMILYHPFNVLLACTDERFSAYLCENENDAYRYFVSPHQLSNGLWTESKGVPDRIMNMLKKNCEAE